jgi:16S rRNA (guanine527-N7)-methyltransferase
LTQTDGAAAAASGATAAARATRLAFEALLTDAPELARRLPPGYGDAAERYVALLLEANRRLNLTRVVTPDEVARLHLLDALAAIPLLDEAGDGPALDLGSGGGVPGIPLALADPDRPWTLVDSVAKKAAAMRGFVQALGLRHVHAVAERAESLGRDPANRERHRIVTARAVGALPVLVELGLPLLAVGGRLIAWKGPMAASDDEALRGARAGAQLGGSPPRIEPAGPAALGGHTLIIVDKVRPTAARFPRRPGDPGRRPLA